MADIERMKRALVNAHKAGDKRAATILAKALKKEMQTASIEGAGVPKLQRTGVQAPIRASNPNRNPDGTYGQPPEGMVLNPDNNQMVDAREIARQQGPRHGAAVTAQHGILGVGNFYDEVVGEARGPVAKEVARQSRDMYRKQFPGRAAAVEIGAGLASLPAIPVGMIGQGIARMLPASRSGQIAGGMALGTLGGGTEGAVSGYADGTTGNRGDRARRRGSIGAALGGGLGLAAPLVSGMASSASKRLLRSPERATASALGVSTPSVRALQNVVDADAAGSVAKNGMLADVGPTAAGTLDGVMQSTGAGARIGSQRVEARAAGALADTNKALDDALGAPVDVKQVQQAARQGSATARSTAYDAAYATPIDYSVANGMQLEGLLPRVPKEAITRANALMKVRGEESAQILVDEAGNLTRLPDVRQWDYITRGLRDVASEADGRGKLGGQTDLGASYQSLATDIRSLLKESVPEYGRALSVASDAISQVQGAELGYKMLRANVSRGDFARRVKAAEAPEKRAMEQGLRSYVDDTLARVRAVASDPNIDAREARAALQSLSSRDAQDKIKMLLGGKRSKPLLRSLNKAQKALELRAAVAKNSRTFGRQQVKETIDDMTAPAGIAELSLANPVGAAQTIMRDLTGNTTKAGRERAQKIMGEIADVLTRQGTGEAREALELLKQVNLAQPVSEALAAQIGRSVTAALAVPAYQQGQRTIGAPMVP